MAKIISIALQKGGCGKSTTADMIASIMGGIKNKKVLLIDMDAQANSTSLNTVNPERTLSDVLSGECSIKDAVLVSKHYDLIAADDYLSNVERANLDNYNILSDLLEPLRGEYDYIIIDTPPALGNLLKMALQASEEVIIPTDPRPFNIRGIYALMPTINAVQETNPGLHILGILLVKHHRRSILNRQVQDMLEDTAREFGTFLFKSSIRESIALPESQALQTPLIDYAPKSNPCKDYIQFTDELLERMSVNG